MTFSLDKPHSDGRGVMRWWQGRWSTILQQLSSRSSYRNVSFYSIIPTRLLFISCLKALSSSIHFTAHKPSLSLPLLQSSNRRHKIYSPSQSFLMILVTLLWFLSHTWPLLDRSDLHTLDLTEYFTLFHLYLLQVLMHVANLSLPIRLCSLQ